jgi:hypothetical protein
MHSFQPSRGRILFEVFCALAISASFVGTWMQTQGWAMLPAALVALLWGLIHAFEMRSNKTAGLVEPQRVEPILDPQEAAPARRLEAPPPALADQLLTSYTAPEQVAAVKPAASKTGKGRRTKAPGKGNGRSTNLPKGVKAAKPASSELSDLAVIASHEEPAHHSLAPLFEPEPFARQRHAVFGRKAG